MMSAALNRKTRPSMILVKGAIFNPLSDKKCEFFPEGCLLYIKHPKTAPNKTQIVFCGPFSGGEKIYKKFQGEKCIQDYTHHPIMPGFYDMHFHWVQDHVRLKGKASLLKWLKKYTWPFEAKFSNIKFTVREAKKFFKRLSQTGTIGGGIYSSMHHGALEQAMNYARGHFVIGNVLMSMNSPDYLIHSDQEGMRALKKFPKKYGKRYAPTPRFAPTTSVELMKEASQVVKKHKLFMQTHLAETPEECAYVMSLFKNHPAMKGVNNYTEIYHRVGLLGPRSLFGHGIYLSSKELNLLGKSKSVIIHCPTSNAPLKERGLGSGLFNFKRAESFGVRWALGSDIGGGPFLSMIDVMRSFVLQNQKAKRKGATFTKALYRATLAGAEILENKKGGNFKRKKEASFVVFKDKLGQMELNQKCEEVLKKLILKNKHDRKSDDLRIKSTIFDGDILGL